MTGEKIGEAISGKRNGEVTDEKIYGVRSEETYGKCKFNQID